MSDDPSSAPNVELPIHYVESSMMTVAYAAATSRLQALTPAGMRVVELVPGRAPLAIICFDYTATSIGPYGEIGIGWPVVDSTRWQPPLLPLLLERRWPRMGWWVHHLPVTTEVALRAGRSIWGYPKFLAEIGFEWHGPRRICTLAADGSEILRVALDTRLPARPSRFPLKTYSVLDDQLLATTIDVDAVGIRRQVRVSAELTLGAHPVGRELAELDLNLSRPVEVRWFPSWRALLPEAQERRPISDAGTSAGAAAASRAKVA